MALGNTRMRWSGTRMVLGNTRMDEEDDVLNVFWSLLVRVWECDTRSIRVWTWAIRVWIWSGVGNTRMGIGNTRMGRLVVFPGLLLCSFWLFRLSEVT
jgi:hypothetical protein